MIELVQPLPGENTPSSSETSMFSGLIRWLRLLFVLYLTFLALLVCYQRSLVFHPNRCDPLIASQYGPTNSAVDLTVKSYDGLELHGWLCLATADSKSELPDIATLVSDSRPVVWFIPGNAGNRAMRQIQLSVLHSLNAHAVIFDHRGYGDNTGHPAEEEIARDVRSIWNYLTQELEIAPHRIVIYGESLGGGIATRLVSELCIAGIEPGGFVMQSTFCSLVAAAQSHFPFVPVSLLLVDRFPSDQRIPFVTCPILQIHGKQDTIVPFPLGQRLFDLAPATSSSGVAKRQCVLAQTDHNDVYRKSNIEHSSLIAELKNFIDAVEATSRAANLTTEKQKAILSNDLAEVRGWARVDRRIPTVIVILLMIFGVSLRNRQWPAGQPATCSSSGTQNSC